VRQFLEVISENSQLFPNRKVGQKLHFSPLILKTANIFFRSRFKKIQQSTIKVIFPCIWRKIPSKFPRASVIRKNLDRLRSRHFSTRMTRGAQRERERARAESRDKKHTTKEAAGSATERRERDAQAVREKAARAAAAKAGGS
jgi:hypothetical protein